MLIIFSHFHFYNFKRFIIFLHFISALVALTALIRGVLLWKTINKHAAVCGPETHNENDNDGRRQRTPQSSCYEGDESSPTVDQIAHSTKADLVWENGWAFLSALSEQNKSTNFPLSPVRRVTRHLINGRKEDKEWLGKQCILLLNLNLKAWAREKGSCGGGKKLKHFHRTKLSKLWQEH